MKANFSIRVATQPCNRDTFPAVTVVIIIVVMVIAARVGIPVPGLITLSAAAAGAAGVRTSMPRRDGRPQLTGTPSGP
jgi:hypothetical protein